jgi:hypothetical protein
MDIARRDVDCQRKTVLIDCEMDFDATDLLATVDAPLEATRRRAARSVTPLTEPEVPLAGSFTCERRKGAVDDNSARLRVIAARDPPGPAQAVEPTAPQAEPGPATKQRKQGAEWDLAQLPDGPPLHTTEAHTHQSAITVLRSGAPVSAGFGPDRIGLASSAAMAASSVRTASTKASTSENVSQEAGEVCAGRVAVPICCLPDGF